MGEMWVLASDYDSKLCFYSASSLSNIVKVDICLVSYPEKIWRHQFQLRVLGDLSSANIRL